MFFLQTRVWEPSWLRYAGRQGARESPLRAGAHGGGATPGPIPNPEVKPSIAESTAGSARGRVGRRRHAGGSSARTNDLVTSAVRGGLIFSPVFLLPWDALLLGVSFWICLSVYALCLPPLFLSLAFALPLRLPPSRGYFSFGRVLFFLLI